LLANVGTDNVEVKVLDRIIFTHVLHQLSDDIIVVVANHWVLSESNDHTNSAVVKLMENNVIFIQHIYDSLR
jgi:hypothetical protein